MADEERNATEPSSEGPNRPPPVTTDHGDETDEVEQPVLLESRPLALRGTDGDDSDEDDVVLPGQMGHRRYVYATFFAFGIAFAYFFSRMGFSLWHRLSQWAPQVGEPREDLVTPIGAVLAAIVVFAVYRRPRVRELSDEVALELSKVEWPSRETVRRSTTIVVLASLGSSLAFWLYDIGTNKAVTFVTSSPHPLLYGLGAGVIIYGIRTVGSRFIAGTGR